MLLAKEVKLLCSSDGILLLFLDCYLNDDYIVPQHALSSDINEINLTSGNGGHYILPSGVEIIFPKHCLLENIELYSRVIPPDDVNVHICETEQLLSSVLEMKPSPLQFKKVN